MQGSESATAASQGACFGDWDVPEARETWSPGLGSLLGEEIPLGAVPLAWWRQRIHPEDAERAVAGLSQAVAHGAERWSGDYRLLRCDGEVVRVRERAFIVRGPQGVLRVVRSIHAAAADEQEGADPTGSRVDSIPSLAERLEQSEEQFRTFVESIAQLAWGMTPEGWIDFYNQRWYDYTATSLEQMEGWGWLAVHDPYDLPRMLRIWRRALATGQPWEDEFRLRRADGAMRWHLSRAMPVRDAAGNVVRWFGTNTDIHDQKLALQERSRLLEREQQARHEAEQASRAKDEFLAVVSHELRTPLNAILGWTSLLREGLLSPEEQRDALARIERSARHQGVLIEDLLDTSRILSGKLQIERRAVPLAVPVRAAVEAMQTRAHEHGVEIAVHDRGGDALVLGDDRRLEQIVSNLLDNAVKFSRERGSVQVRLERRDGALWIEVEDAGEGIDAAFLPHLFQRFRQADASTTREHGGLGLGLSIVRQLVELHGGDVQAHSEGRGRGACFRVRLPEAEALPHEVAPAEGEPGGDEPISLRGIRVLAVDDDAETRALLAALLLSAGGSVVTAGSVAEALHAVRVELPDVIVSDIAMPLVDGYGLVTRVRALEDVEAAAIPIVALTAFASRQDRERALATGFDRYLPKPVDPRALYRTLSDLVRRRLTEEG